MRFSSSLQVYLSEKRCIWPVRKLSSPKSKSLVGFRSNPRKISYCKSFSFFLPLALKINRILINDRRTNNKSKYEIPCVGVGEYWQEKYFATKEEVLNLFASRETKEQKRIRPPFAEKTDKGPHSKKHGSPKRLSIKSFSGHNIHSHLIFRLL